MKYTKPDSSDSLAILLNLSFATEISLQSSLSIAKEKADGELVPMDQGIETMLHKPVTLTEVGHDTNIHISWRWDAYIFPHKSR
jgi:hypothetical protein